MWIVLGEVLGVAMAWALVGLPFKEYTDRYDSITVPDYLEGQCNSPMPSPSQDVARRGGTREARKPLNTGLEHFGLANETRAIISESQAGCRGAACY